jgi:hypothetical protein
VPYFGKNILFIGKTIKHNQFLQCCLHIALLLWHPTQYTTPKDTTNKAKHTQKKQVNGGP